MPLPNPDEYANALQNLRQTVADEELREGRLALTPLGLPMLWSGGFADVYRVHCPRTGNTWAVKCFTREIPAREERYRQIADHLEQARLPFTMEFKYLQRGVLVNGAWLPIVKMRWVDGHLLNEFVEGHLDQPQRLRQFLHLWVKMADRLRAADTAHADLQHGNVLLVPVRDDQLALRLIDYDGMYLPTLADVRSGESGHAAYQHPQRLRQHTYSGEVDRFPQLAIYCAIHCVVTEGPLLWERFNNGDNLLFRELDFLEPAASDLFHTLWESRNKHSRALAGRLVLACNAPLEHTPLLCEVVDGRRARPLTPGEETAVCEVLQVGERGFMPAAGGATSSPLREDLATRSDGFGTASESQTDWGLSGAPDPQATGDQWYIMVADQIVGPVNRDDLKPLVQEGSVKPATLVRQPAGGQWLQARVIEGLFEASQSSDAAQTPKEPTTAPEPANLARPRPDSDQWHFLVADQIVGPVSRDDLKRLAREGSVKPATLVRQPTGKEWVPARAIQGLFEPSRSSEAAKPPPEEPSPRSGSEPEGMAEVQQTAAELPAAITNSIGMRLALIPPGEFMMGSPDSEKGSATEGPRHLVRITKPFYLGVYEVTQAEYGRVMGTNPSAGWLVWLFGGTPDPRKPVDRVSWADATEFCRRLGQQEGRTYRLPTEAEWEYACRAGTTTPFHFGTELDGSQANCHGRYPYGTTIPGPYLERTVSVGSYPANAFGLYDMHGNVCEWCSDCFDAKYYAQSPVDDPPGPTAGARRVVRGGSWHMSPQYCRSGSRDWRLPNSRVIGTGFRVVWVPAAGDESAPPPAAQSVTVTEPTTPLEEIDWQAVWRRIKTAWRSALRSTWRALCALDRGLALVAGEDNVILRGFLRIVALVIAAVLVILLFGAIRTSAPTQPQSRAVPTGALAIAEVSRRSLALPTDEEEFALDLGEGVKLEMVLIPAGEFMMGSPDSDREADSDERPQHRVRITRPFYLGKYPVTQQQWEVLMESTPSRFKGPQNPVEWVSWNDCQDFLRRLNEKTGDRRREFRLPTEAEWEYACQAGASTRYSFGDDAEQLGEYAWYAKNSGSRTHQVGQKRANPWGLYDMHGNVWEWCADWYDSGYHGTSSVDDPHGPASGSRRVYRGGSWGYTAGGCRSAARGWLSPDARGDDRGFRLALVPAE